jgi:hypothetical protein
MNMKKIETRDKKKKARKEWAREMRRKYPDRFPPLYWLFFDWGFYGNKKADDNK